jgi:hypothetical protein
MKQKYAPPYYTNIIIHAKSLELITFKLQQFERFQAKKHDPRINRTNITRHISVGFYRR